MRFRQTNKTRTKLMWKREQFHESRSKSGNYSDFDMFHGVFWSKIACSWKWRNVPQKWHPRSWFCFREVGNTVINQPINKSTNQKINQLINPPNQSVSQSINWSINPPINQSMEYIGMFISAMGRYHTWTWEILPDSSNLVEWLLLNPEWQIWYLWVCL